MTAKDKTGPFITKRSKTTRSRRLWTNNFESDWRQYMRKCMLKPSTRTS